MILQSPSEYKNEYDSRLNDTSRYPNLTKLDAAGMAYDAIWTIALSLHNASESVRINDSRGCENYAGELVSLEKFDYRNKMMGCVFRRSITNIDFSGITVSIAITISSECHKMPHCFRVILHSMTKEVVLTVMTLHCINIE